MLIQENANSVGVRISANSADVLQTKQIKIQFHEALEVGKSDVIEIISSVLLQLGQVTESSTERQKNMLHL